MASHLDQSDLASFDRRVADMKKSDGNPSKHAVTSDAENLPASSSSSSTAIQFSADWSRFETDFARGLRQAQHYLESRVTHEQY